MQDDWTALAWAIDRGYADIARFLLEKGATMNFENEEVRKTDIILFLNNHFIMVDLERITSPCQ